MNLNYSEEQVMLREQIQKFCESEYDFYTREKIVKSSDDFDSNVWKLFAEQGWLSMPFSEENGGLGFGAVELAVLFEEFGKALVIEPYLATVVLSGTLIDKSIPPILSWFFIEASFAGDTKDVCTGSGACWTYIKVWFRRFMYGMYPNAEQWRINLSFIALTLLGSIGYFATDKFKKYLTLYYVVIYPLIAFLFIFFFISGGPIFFDFSYGIIAAIISIIVGFFIPSKFKFYYFLIIPFALYIILKYFIFFEEAIELGKLDGLNWVETGAWGGLSLTFIISFFCLIFCFPIGMAFALGRRSGFPLIRYISIGFIEFWRGVPLITVLFMSAVMFPMFLPEDFFIDKLVRAIIAISLFEAAYVAEVIRGGLQALPRGQYEAAKSLGMGYWKMHIFVILPQALKLVIPGIANTFLALVKDTPLIFVVGLLEIVGMLNLAKTNPKWLGFAMEGYVFAAIIFWIICYAMSKYSYNLEIKYKTDR